MFKLIRRSMYLKVVDVMIDSKLHIICNVDNYTNVSNNKFSYVNNRRLSQSLNSRVKKKRYSKRRV